jgi:beta-N-acetylhexosaminidase
MNSKSMFSHRYSHLFMKQKFQKGFIVFAIAVFTGVFFQFSIDRRPVCEQEFIFKPSPPPFLKDSSIWADSVLNTLSLSERIGQLFMVAAYPNKGKEDMRRVSELIKNEHVGGIIFFQGTPEEVARLACYYQSISKIPLLIGIDGEWGPSMRIDQTIRYPRQMMLGAVNDNDLIYLMGRDIARQLKMLGIHVNFAPVIDVNNNPENPVINSRSFGENRENVARKGILYMKGMQDEGILAVAKHFPGHGDTDVDSHTDLPVITYSVHRLDSIELFPFRALIESGISGVMTAHLSVPNLDTTPNLPSTLSAVIADSLLKGTMHFNGLVFTDAMTMKGITNLYNPVASNCMAVLAGNDIVLMPEEVKKSIDSIIMLIDSGSLTNADINARCKKILKAKEWAVLPAKKGRTLCNQDLIDSLNSPWFELVRRQLIEQAITLVDNKHDIIPVKDLARQHIAVLSLGSDTLTEFQRAMSLYTNTGQFHLNGNEDSATIAKTIDTLNSYNLIFLSLHSNEFRAVKQFGISDELIHLADIFLSCYPTILTVFTSPYVLNRLKYLSNNIALIEAYDNDSTTQNITAQMIFGGIGARGRLPVSINHTYKAGTGVNSEGNIRLRYTTPLEAGFNANMLKKIDSIVIAAILKRAMPGCQILAAKDGKVFFQKSYGYFDYYKKHKVENTDLYDLASVTKVVATVPSIMILDENGQIDIRNRLSDYLPELDSTNKDHLRVEDILLHQAGLQPFIPFYMSTLDPVYPNQEITSTRYSKQYPIMLGKNMFVNRQLKYTDNCYSREPDPDYPVEIADGLYMNTARIDSIFQTIYASDVNKPGKYAYSDLGFILFYQMIERMTGKELDAFADSCLYVPLGATTLTYKPLQKFDKGRIAPTENDLIFRRQIVQGYVHDPTAAMLGGVSGHAGLFSDANDLAKYLQMLLNDGCYGGEKILDDGLIKKYTSCIACENGNRRGLGFDKPEADTTRNGPAFKGISQESFGHTGFTGTMIWADPSTGILYIFLSNRVYPDAVNNQLLEMNIRTKVQKAIYDARIEK